MLSLCFRTNSHIYLRKIEEQPKALSQKKLRILWLSKEVGFRREKGLYHLVCSEYCRK